MNTNPSHMLYKLYNYLIVHYLLTVERSDQFPEDRIQMEKRWNTAIDGWLYEQRMCFIYLGCMIPALYFMGPKLPVNIIFEPECYNIFKLLSTSGRLLNDIQGFEVIEMFFTL